MRMIKKKVHSRLKRTHASRKVSARVLKLKKYKTWNARYYRMFRLPTRRKQHSLLGKRKRRVPTPKIAAIPVPAQTPITEIDKELSKSKGYEEAYIKGFNNGFNQGFEDGNRLGYKP